jgi:hypothetical protein
MGDSWWIVKDIPTMLHTLRLFLVIVAHRSVRQLVSELPNLVDFLKKVVLDGDAAMLAIVVTILRRIPLSASLVKALSRSEFLLDFIKKDRELFGSSGSEALLLLIGTIGEVGYAEEYVKVADGIARHIVSGDELSVISGQVAVTLCRYKKCAARFRDQRLASFYRKRVDHPYVGEQAKLFLEAAVSSDDGEEDDSENATEI